MSNIGSYEERLKDFSWDEVRAELGSGAGDAAQHRRHLHRPHLRAWGSAARPP